MPLLDEGYFDADGTISNGCELRCPILPHATCTKCPGNLKRGSMGIWEGYIIYLDLSHKEQPFMYR